MNTLKTKERYQVGEMRGFLAAGWCGVWHPVASVCFRKACGATSIGDACFGSPRVAPAAKTVTRVTAAKTRVPITTRMDEDAVSARHTTVGEDK